MKRHRCIKNSRTLYIQPAYLILSFIDEIDDEINQ